MKTLRILVGAAVAALTVTAAAAGTPFPEVITLPNGRPSLHRQRTLRRR